MNYRPIAFWILSISLFFAGLPSRSQGANDPFKHSARISYFGKSIMHPGLKFSTPLVRIVSDPARLQKEFSLSPCLGIYYHPGNHTGLFLSGEASFRITFPKGLFLETYLGAGYLRTFLDGKTYVVGDNGDVKRRYLAGDHQFMPSAGLGAGISNPGTSSPILGYFLRAGGFLQYPYNSMWLPNLNVELGILLNLSRTKS